MLVIVAGQAFLLTVIWHKKGWKTPSAKNDKIEFWGFVNLKKNWWRQLKLQFASSS